MFFPVRSFTCFYEHLKLNGALRFTCSSKYNMTILCKRYSIQVTLSLVMFMQNVQEKQISGANISHNRTCQKMIFKWTTGLFLGMSRRAKDRLCIRRKVEDDSFENDKTIWEPVVSRLLQVITKKYPKSMIKVIWSESCERKRIRLHPVSAVN